MELIGAALLPKVAPQPCSSAWADSRTMQKAEVCLNATTYCGTDEVVLK